ncbi:MULTISPECIES: hypothetical protein [Rhodobacterales]
MVLILLGALVKKLVRGTAFQASDFFLGVELSLAALTSSLIFIFEVSGSSTADQSKAVPLGIFTASCLFLFFVVMAFHQDWEKRPQNPRGQFVWLGGFCNLIGIGLLSSFVLFVKGIQ